MGATTATHYERLGVTPTASTEELRAAYRSLAQRMHPDRMGQASPAERALAERRMREINESWSVLSDPAKRRAYDDERLGRTTHASPAPSRPTPPARVAEDDDLVDVAPPMTAVQVGLFRHLPWVVLVVVFGVIFVLTAYAGSQDDPPSSTFGSGAVAGDCIDVSAGPTTSIVPCDGPHELTIVERVVLASECPAGTEARRLAADGRYDCVTEP